VRDEGYIKFNSQLHDSFPPAEWDVEQVNLWRDRLFAMKLIGAYDDGIGYGNISIRSPHTDEFIITGTSTGGLSLLFPEHFTRVKGYNIGLNSVVCEGKIHASSETMTHAAVYACDSNIGAVVHIHSADHWNRMLNNIPTTSPSAAYGTPEMAHEIFRLYKETDFPEVRVMAMAGHEEGILSFGRTLDDAGSRLLEILNNK